MKPFFYVVGGPNGVGKSTASFQYLPKGVELINSDDIARQLRQEQIHQEVIQQMANDDLPILYQRVLNRHLQGGHFVREDVIRGRYVAGLSLLNHFFNEPDSLALIDSSDQLELVYQRVDGTLLVQKDPLPAWVAAHLSTHIDPKPDVTNASPSSSIDEVRAQYQQRTQPPLSTKTPNEPPRL